MYLNVVTEDLTRKNCAKVFFSLRYIRIKTVYCMQTHSAIHVLKHKLFKIMLTHYTVKLNVDRPWLL